MKKQGVDPRVPISWDEYFMRVAYLSSHRSKDPSTQVGACIVNKDNHIIGTGYNGMPGLCEDKAMPWDKEGRPEDTKYPYIVHAEVNAVLNTVFSDLSSCRIYVTHKPCPDCLKVLLTKKIRIIIYSEDLWENHNPVIQRLCESAGVSLHRYDIESKSFRKEIN